jgi:hypothetical protein
MADKGCNNSAAAGAGGNGFGLDRFTPPALRSKQIDPFDAEPISLEEHIPGLRVHDGFADAFFGDLIFEFKRHLDDAGRSDGLGMLERYLGNQSHPELYFGILTDGECLEGCALSSGGLTKVDGLTLNADLPAESKLWLDCYLFHEKHLTPTAGDVVRRFGEKSPSFWHSQRSLNQLWGQLGAEPSAQTKLAEWQGLLSIVYGAAVGDESLFLRHTYLALFARVRALVTLERRAPTDRELTASLPQRPPKSF